MEINCNRITIDSNCNLHIIDNDYNCHYVQVFILKLVSSTSTQIIIKDNRFDDVSFNTEGDGYYTITKLTVPLDKENPYYYNDGKFYHNGEEITLQQLLEINPNTTGLEIDYIHYFSICNLKKCFIAMCQQIFEQQSSICNKNNVDSFLIYKRDLLWSAINVINYLVDMQQYEEAQSILEQMTECNGLCPPQTGKVNCGCSK